MLKTKRGEFKIAVNPKAFGAGEDNGIRKGWLCGPLAIHGNKYGYTVTHLASGYAAGTASGLAATKILVEKMLTLPVDWTLADPLQKVSEETRMTIREWNQGRS